MTEKTKESDFAINYDRVCIQRDREDRINKERYLQQFRNENKRVRQMVSGCCACACFPPQNLPASVGQFFNFSCLLQSAYLLRLVFLRSPQTNPLPDMSRKIEVDSAHRVTPSPTQLLVKTSLQSFLSLVGHEVQCPFPFIPILYDMWYLTASQFYLTDLSHDSLAPGGFSTMWCPL